MIVSEARNAANRANAALSTGPKTAEGKERSRANAYKHGMTGAGVVLPTEDAAEVERRFAALKVELAPKGEVQEALVRKVSLFTVRMERCAVNEAAAISARIRNAEDDFDEAREDEADRLMAEIEEDPARSVRKLRRMPEGVDRLLATWTAIRADVACSSEDRWEPCHRTMAENLTGRRLGDFGTSRIEALARAIEGDFTLLDDREGAGLADRARASWARGQMVALIDAEVAKLRAHRDTLDLDRIAADRAGAADRALFDPSKEATLARRYEAAADRGFSKALKDLKEAKQAEPAAREASPAYPPRSLASFSPPAPRPAPKPVETPQPIVDRASSYVPITVGRPEPGRDAAFAR